MANHGSSNKTIIDNSNFTLVGNILTYTSLSGSTFPIDLSPYLDDTNLARIISGAVVGTDIVLTRDDSSNFNIDISSILTSISNAVQSVNGNIVDNTDPQNPIVNETITSITGTPFELTYNKEQGGSDIISIGNPAVNYINSDTSTNLNTNAALTFDTLVPIFSLNDEVHNGNLNFTKISDTELRVEFDGFALVGFNIHITGNTQRTAVQARLKVNTTVAGPIASTGYIRSGGQGHVESSLHTTFIHYFTSGDLINIGTRREASPGVVVMESSGTSNFFIQKLS